MANWWTWTLIYFPSWTDIISSQRWVCVSVYPCMWVHSCTLVSQCVHAMWIRALVCCVETGSVQTQFPLYSRRNVPAATAIKVVNNPSHQLRQQPPPPKKKEKKKPTQRQCQWTQPGVCGSNRDVTSLTQHSLRFQLAFRAARWLNLLQTNKISAQDVLICQV